MKLVEVPRGQGLKNVFCHRATPFFLEEYYRIFILELMHQIPGTNCQDLSKECGSQPHKLSCWLADERAWVYAREKGVL